MDEIPAWQRGRRADRRVVWSAAGGLLTALLVVAITGRLTLDEQANSDTTLGALGLSAAFMAPFVASFASFLVRDVKIRRAVWLAGGVLALILGGLTIFSGVGWLFGAAGAGLLSAWWQSRGGVALLGPPRAVALIAWLILCLCGALGVLWLRQTPVCRDAIAHGPNQAMESITTTCNSDITDDAEGLLALGGIAIGFTGMAVIVRGGSAAGSVTRARTIREKIGAGGAARR